MARLPATTVDKPPFTVIDGGLSASDGVQTMTAILAATDRAYHHLVRLDVASLPVMNELGQIAELASAYRSTLLPPERTA